MKEFFWFVIGSLLIVGLMSGSGIESSLEFNPEFSPKVGYMPDNRVISIDNLQQIDTNVENQYIIIGIGQTNTSSTDGVTTIDPDHRLCQPLPGETIYEGPDAKGACFVEDQSGNRYFLNAAGSRWPIDSSPGETDIGALSLEQLETAYVNAGGELPWSWNMKSEELKIEWLKQQLERGE